MQFFLVWKKRVSCNNRALNHHLMSNTAAIFTHLFYLIYSNIIIFYFDVVHVNFIFFISIIFNYF